VPRVTCVMGSLFCRRDSLNSSVCRDGVLEHVLYVGMEYLNMFGMSGWST
jgi:hypothetical protein